MRGPRLITALWTVLFLAEPVAAQMTMQQARDEGRTLGQAKRADPTLVPTGAAQAEAVPGYTGTAVPEGTYFSDPESLEATAQAAKATSEPYQITVDAGRSRPTFSNAEILGTTHRATTVENDPATYLAGEAVTSSDGSCTPLPPGTGTSSSYEATCNTGTKLEESAPSCDVPLDVAVTGGLTAYQYTCESIFDPSRHNRSELCTPLIPFAASGTCHEVSRVIIGQQCFVGAFPDCLDPGEPVEEVTYDCAAAVTTALPYATVEDGASVTATRNEGQCNATIAGKTCALTAEICTDSAPATRLIDGHSVTQPCWAWQRTYSCQTESEADDCADLAGNHACTYLREECLDEEPSGTCKVKERVYQCPTPASTSADPKQYICGDDVYCLGGDCEPIAREASTEFKDALVALHAIDQAGKEFDQTNFKVFGGTRETCHKPLFGLVNCCAGKVSGLVPVAAGAAALAGGPAAIAAFATPFLVLFTCSQDEMKLDIQDRMGFCHRIGSYCSSSVLGICKTKRTAYCCFESKLSRVLQEQGRVQLGKAWAKPKKEQCIGFTVDEFARLDLSVMDFTEVYADFMDAAKLPDEVATMADIQDKIRGYYDLHGE